jgi:hypothetical protein
MAQTWPKFGGPRFVDDRSVYYPMAAPAPAQTLMATARALDYPHLNLLTITWSASDNEIGVVIAPAS